MFFLSHHWQRCHEFKYFGQHFVISGKSKIKHELGIDVYRSGSACLDAYPDQDPAK
jgi:hypothetical protein